MATYPDHKTYRDLYARYYDRHSIHKLLELLGPLSGLSLLDLCCGDGRLALGALINGAAAATLVDKEASMIAESLKKNPKIEIVVEAADVALVAFDRIKTFDRIACCQAVNYWLNKRSAKLLARVLKPGGLFVFNTFNEKPSRKPRVLEYELKLHQFVEISWFEKGLVHHVQIREGLPPHVTNFWWLSPEDFRLLLEPHFEVEELREGKTSLYRCVKR